MLLVVWPMVQTTAQTTSVAASDTMLPAHTPSQHEAELATGTETLYRLTRELKLELEKGGTGTLSATTAQKAAEIEKLAHRLNEEMKKK